MKKLITMTIMVLAVAVAMAQAPEKFTYQAVVRNASNSLVANAPVGVRVSILQGSASGSAVYVETQTATTNANGLVTLSIGGGNVQQGAFADIDWANGTYFLKTETDPDGGTNYSITSTQQMLSVPYALYAKEAGNIPTVPANVSAFTNDAGYITGYTETDPTVPAWAKEANKPTYNYSEIVNTPTIPTVPTNVSAFTNDAGYLTNFTETDPTVPAWAKEANKPTYNYSEIVNTPEIPTVPTNVSAFTNDAGYLTNYTETDPTVPAWAKEATKPAYDYSEIANTPTIPAVPTNVSAFTNDAGYITANDVPEQVNADWNATSGEAEILNKPTLFSGSYNDLTDKPTIPEEANNATLTIQRNESLVGTFTADASTNTTINIVVPTTTSDLVNNSGYITAADIPEIPTNVSAFTNDAGYLTTAQCGDIDICDLAELVAQLQQQVATLQQQIDSLQGQSGQDTTINPIDTTTILLPTVFTSTASNITSTSAMVGGNVTSDGGASVIARGVCRSTSQNPSVNDSHTTDGGGMGSFTSNITGLAANTTYYVRAYATNSAGTAYGEEVTFTTLSAGGTAVIDEKSCPEAQTVTDHEGNVYATVQIGNQCWMRDNLRTTTSPSTGTYLIPAADADYTYTGKQARWYNNDSVTYAPMNYGLLYNWNAAVDTFNTAYGEISVNTDNSNAVSVSFTGHRRGICPAGWHLPNDAEWTAMEQTQTSMDVTGTDWRGDHAGKLAGEGWSSSTTAGSPSNASDPAHNASGFSAVPAGGCYGSSFGNAGGYAIFWSSAQGYSYNAYTRVLYYLSAHVYRNYANKYNGYSVRCLRDESGGTAQEQPTATTAPATDLTATSATLNGTITNPDNVTVTWQGFEWKATTGGTYTQVNAMGETMAYSLTGLTANTSYTYRAFVTTANGTSYGAEVTFTTLSAGYTAVIDEKSCPEAQTVTDHEGNVYATVQIGNQCWMRDNLRTTTSPSTGTYLIPAADADHTFTGKQARWYNNDSATYAPMNYGLLYNWNAAVDTFNTAYGETSVNTSSSNAVSVTFIGPRRGICPAGWHLPSDAEWTAMEQTQTSMDVTGTGWRGDHAGKLAGEGWSSSTAAGVPGNASVPAHNASGFSAVPAGHCNGSSFRYAGDYADFWSSTQYGSNYAYFRILYYNSASVYSANGNKNVGSSVRCLRDESGGTAQEQPTVTTAPATDLTATFATLTGTLTNPDNVTVTAQGFEWKATTGGTYTQVNAMGETMAYSLTGLTANTSYTYRAFVTTANGTSYGEEVTFTTLSAGGTAVIDEKSCPEAQTVTDHEGNVYATVQIGNQCWMRENLRTTHYADGTAVPAGGGNTSDTDPYYYDYSSSGMALAQRGYLYNWPAAMHGASSSSANPSGVQGICPAGWHLPSDAEWTTLTDYVSSQSEFQCGGNSNYIAKALASTEGWSSYSSNCVVGNDPSSNNATGFSAVPAGSFLGSSFAYAGANAYFWSSSQNFISTAYYRYLDCNYANVARGNYTKNLGYSVRCLRD